LSVRLVVASANRKKLAELIELLRGAPVEIVSAAELSLPDVEETGSTFEENAAIKAIAASRASGMLALADDSGLEVDALGGAPGVRSARYASNGPGNASDADNRAKLLSALRDVAEGRRTARFRCAIAVARGEEVVLRADGSVEGAILDRERGSLGFGYDPLFVPRGATRTFAEMPPDEKARWSHRARALAALRPGLVALRG